MGKNEEDNIPVVHPQICVSEDHFAKNTAFTDDKYQPLQDKRQAYMEAKKVAFDDLSQ